MNASRQIIEDLLVNVAMKNGEYQKFLEYYLENECEISYSKDYDGSDFKMVYPEKMPASYDRYLAFQKKCQDNEFNQEEDKVVILVSHGNSVMSFMELTDPDAKKKDLIGIDYCSLSIIKKNQKNW